MSSHSKAPAKKKLGIRHIHTGINGYVAIETDPDEDADDLGIKESTFSKTEAETLGKAKELVGEGDLDMSKAEFEKKYKMEITECERWVTTLSGGEK